MVIANWEYMEFHMKNEVREGQEESWKSTLRKETNINYSVPSEWNEGDGNTIKEVESGYVGAQKRVTSEWSSLGQLSRGEDT